MDSRAFLLLSINLFPHICEQKKDLNAFSCKRIGLLTYNYFLCLAPSLGVTLILLEHIKQTLMSPVNDSIATRNTATTAMFYRE